LQKRGFRIIFFFGRATKYDIIILICKKMGYKKYPKQSLEEQKDEEQQLSRGICSNNIHVLSSLILVSN